ncbi:MAG: Biotin-lipoyl like, partial [Planctomycetota bacterium]
MRLMLLLAAAAALGAVETATAAPIAGGGREWLTGTVRPATAATVRARIGGVLERIAVRPGDRVAAGAVLAELDGRETAARLAQAEAAL